MLGAGTAAAETLVSNLGETTANVRRKPEYRGCLAGVHDRLNRRRLRAHRGQGRIRDGPEPHGDGHGVHRRRSGSKRQHHRDADEPGDVGHNQHVHRTGWDHARRQHELPPHHRGHGRRLALTTSDSEDSGGVTGWSIGDSVHQRTMVSDSGLGGTWVDITSKPQNRRRRRPPPTAGGGRDPADTDNSLRVLR